MRIYFIEDFFYTYITYILEEIDKKLPVSMLTFSGVVWPPNNAKPLQPKWAAKWAGPVSFEITYFAPISNFAN